MTKQKDDKLDQFMDELGALMRKYPPLELYDGVGQIAALSSMAGNLIGLMTESGVDPKILNKTMSDGMNAGVKAFHHGKAVMDRAKKRGNRKSDLKVVK